MGDLLFFETFYASTLPSDTELGQGDTDIGQNDMVSDVNSGSDFGDSDVSTELVEDTEIVENIEIVEIPEIVEVVEESEQSETDVPSVYSDQNVEPYASVNDYYTYLPTWVDDYFEGVLQNIGDTEYLAYAYREYASSSSYNYTDYYYLIYDLDIENDVVQRGSYPCMVISRDNGNNGYYVSETVVSSVPVPNIGYGSYGSYSDLRGGVGYVETYTILFAIGFAVVYSVCHDIFDFILGLGKRKGV